MFLCCADQEREVRKITTMKSIWGRQNKPKLKLEINEIGQPCGNSGTRFANFIGTQIRTKGFPVAYDDWRKINLQLKLALWTEAKVQLSNLSFVDLHLRKIDLHCAKLLFSMNSCSGM